MFRYVLLCASLAAGCILAGKTLFHYFQLESYQFPGYFRTLRRNLPKSFLPGLLTAVVTSAVMFIALIFIPGKKSILVYIIPSVLIIAGGYGIGRFFYEKKAKKALVYTPRMKRLYVVAAIVFTVIPLLAVISLGSGTDGNIFEHSVYFILIIFPLLLPVWTACAGLLAWPVEKLISELYFRDAQKILKSRSDLIRIGITGSWGKTSVKFILGTMLEEKYHTLVTPASFNTPMGVTKVIRTRLEPGHRVFVAEMGARHVGDIKEMCRLVHPQIGLITSVGPQHLDTFKTVERVARTKYELIDALPEDGHAFFSDDNGICRNLYKKTMIHKSITGLQADSDDVWAEDIVFSENGSSFCLCTKEIRLPCITSLLGELNIRNILLCAAVCLELGMTGEQIARGIEKIRPVEHRLQLIPSPGGITVIDDAFNSNILGAQQAFKVLKEMPGRRILVTPGMVELGAVEEEMNREFGKSASGCCDTAILVGRKRSVSISDGLIDSGFSKENIIVVSSLAEAEELLKTLARSGDTVLFENDLPDNYSE